MASSMINGVVPSNEAGISNFGKKISYDPSWTGPLNVKRKFENIPFAVAYYLLVCAWIGVAIYAEVAVDPEKLKEQSQQSEFEAYMIFDGWIIGVVLLFAAFWSIMFLVLLRVAAKPVVYTCIGLLFFFLIYWTLSQLYLLLLVQTTGLFIGFVVALSVLLIVTYVFFKKHKFIPMTCEIIREATKAIMACPLVFVYAIVYYFLVVTFTMVSLGMALMIYLISQEDGYYSAHLCLCDVIVVVSIVWINLHLHGMYHVTAAGIYGAWYWATNKRDLPRFTTLRFAYIAVRYHVGSVSFGSLIMSVCAILRALLSHVVSSVGFDGAVDATGAVDVGANLASSGLNCCSSIVHFFHAIVEAVTDMSYVHIAHHGTGFIEAARASFGLFRRNYLKVAVLKQIVTMLRVIATLVITTLSIVVFWGLLRSQSIELMDRVVELTVIIIVVLLMTFVILGILALAVETIFICVLEDYEMNSGSSRPYHMSNKLKDLVLENRLE